MKFMANMNRSIGQLLQLSYLWAHTPNGRGINVEISGDSK